MSTASLWDGVNGLQDAPPPKPAVKSAAIRYHCVVCGRHMISYGEHAYTPSICDSEDCLLHWAIRTAPALTPLCSCPQREYPHELSVHRELKSESYNPANRFRWPWSLVLSAREEPSTERKAA